MQQCNRCLYRDSLHDRYKDGVWCPVAERRADRTDGLCDDFELDDDRWDAAGTGGDA